MPAGRTNSIRRSRSTNKTSSTTAVNIIRTRFCCLAVRRRRLRWRRHRRAGSSRQLPSPARRSFAGTPVVRRPSCLARRKGSAAAAAVEATAAASPTSVKKKRRRLPRRRWNCWMRAKRRSCRPPTVCRRSPIHDDSAPPAASSPHSYDQSRRGWQVKSERSLDCSPLSENFL